MIRCFIQELPVVGHSEKAFFLLQIMCDGLLSPDIQVVCRLIQQYKGIGA